MPVEIPFKAWVKTPLRRTPIGSTLYNFYQTLVQETRGETEVSTEPLKARMERLLEKALKASEKAERLDRTSRSS